MKCATKQRDDLRGKLPFGWLHKVSPRPPVFFRQLLQRKTLLETYCIGWLLVLICIACGATAAVVFEYSNHAFVYAALLQAAGVFLALAIAYLFFEHRTQVRQKKIETTVNWSIDRLGSLTKRAAIETVQQWMDHPARRSEYRTVRNALTYEKARRFILHRPGFLTGYRSETNYFRTLNWVLRSFEEVASFCEQTNRTIGPGLMEYGALIRAMGNLEYYVETERRVWDGFSRRISDPNCPLPDEANYNLLVLAELAVRLADVIDSKGFIGDPEYEARRRYTAEARWYSGNWGDWRP